VKVVVIGAGRIGCGLVGEALRASGHEVVFVARRRILANHLNRIGGYRLRLLACGEARETFVDGVRAVCAADGGRVVKELAEADLIAACVRPRSLPSVAPLIAAGLRQRSSPTNVLSFENLVDAGPALRRRVASHLPAAWPLDEHGFSGALAARVVSRRLGDPGKDDPLTFIGDPPPSFVVDRRALRCPLPEIAGMETTDDYAAAVRQKLHIFSAGHAVAAYLGYLKGYHYIHTAIRDAEIRSAVLAAMAEGRAGLGARLGSGHVGAESDPIKVIVRFDNAALDDPVVRVGRDPQRKLGPGDRLIGAARIAEQAGIRPENLALAAAAALCFEDPHDASSIGLQQRLRRNGVHEVVSRVCRLDPSQGLGRSVAALWSRLSTGRRSGNQLLSLDRLFWAWSSTEAGFTEPPTRAVR
jgi:mannitol-1-phosphate 5-dehydrogenase